MTTTFAVTIAVEAPTPEMAYDRLVAALSTDSDVLFTTRTFTTSEDQEPRDTVELWPGARRTVLALQRRKG